MSEYCDLQGADDSSGTTYAKHLALLEESSEKQNGNVKEMQTIAEELAQRAKKVETKDAVALKVSDGEKKMVDEAVQSKGDSGPTVSYMSSGQWCANADLLFSGKDLDCRDRCVSMPDCVYVTYYSSNTWCQISKTCFSPEPASDGTATTYHVYRHSQPSFSVYGTGQWC
jgi:hypothetical protein